MNRDVEKLEETIKKEAKKLEETTKKEAKKTKQKELEANTDTQSSTWAIMEHARGD